MGGEGAFEGRGMFAQGVGLLAVDEPSCVKSTMDGFDCMTSRFGGATAIHYSLVKDNGALQRVLDSRHRCIPPGLFLAPAQAPIFLGASLRPCHSPGVALYYCFSLSAMLRILLRHVGSWPVT
jgi:hypothetical protein